MTNRMHSGFGVLVVAVGLAGCHGTGTITPTAPATASPQPPPPPPTSAPAFLVAKVTLSGDVFELTPEGRAPLEGVLVANGEGWFGLTDSHGFFSFDPVWVCPCGGGTGYASTTSLWVGKDGYGDPADQAPAGAGGYSGPGYRDVVINGDTRVEIQLVRR